MCLGGRRRRERPRLDGAITWKGGYGLPGRQSELVQCLELIRTAGDGPSFQANFRAFNRLNDQSGISVKLGEVWTWGQRKVSGTINRSPARDRDDIQVDQIQLC